MDLMNFLLPLFLVFAIGIIGVTAGVTWMIVKARYKNKTTTTTPPVIIKEPAQPPLLGLKRASSGEWEIRVNGQVYADLASVPDDTVRREIVAGLKELATFARSYIQKGTPAQKPAAAPAQGLTKPTPAVKTAPSPTAPPSPPTDKVRVFLQGETTLKRQAAAPVMMPTIELAREIGEIVEEMQKRIPSLSGRSIRLQNAPGGGIQFAIDGIVYPDVESIPDLDVQALIRAATQEWERR